MKHTSKLLPSTFLLAHDTTCLFNLARGKKFEHPCLNKDTGHDCFKAL